MIITKKIKNSHYVRILFYTIGTELLPSSRVRVFQYRPWLKSLPGSWFIFPSVNNFFTRIRIAGKRKLILINIVFTINASIRMILFCILSSFFTHIYIQKILFPPVMLPFLQYIFRKKQLFFDMDDAVYSVKKDEHQIKDIAYLNIFKKNMKMYKQIFVSTEKLRENIINEAGLDPKKIIILPNFIDTENFKSSKIGNRTIPVIGWIGTPTNTHYLETPLRALDNLIKKGYQFNVMTSGADKKIISRWYSGKIEFKKWKLKSEVNLYDSLDIGIMPLKKDDWSEGKAAYKLMLYMSMEKISVTSDTEINKSIINNDVNGYLVKNDKDWEEVFTQILNNYSKLTLLRRRAREQIVKHHSLHANYHYFINIFQ